MTHLRAGSATDVGLVRANNQDQMLLASPIFAVADGMGGHAAGEVASQTAVDALRHAFERAEPSALGLLAAAHAANRAVWDAAQSDADLRGMGTTLTAVALVPADGGGQLAVVNVGDSRTYHLRDGQLQQITVDHSYVAELVAEGRIDEAEAEVHPQRHVLTRALGISPDVDIDLLVLPPVPGDRYLLCSDGLSREVTDDQVASTLRRLADPGDAARELVAAAKIHGGSDNITVVVVDVVGDSADEPEPAASEPRSIEDSGADGDAATRVLPVVAVAERPEPANPDATSALDISAPADTTTPPNPTVPVDLTIPAVPPDAAGPDPTGTATNDPATDSAAATDPVAAPDPAGTAGPGAHGNGNSTTHDATGAGAPVSRAIEDAGRSPAGPASGPSRAERRRAAKRAAGPRAQLITFRVVVFLVLLIGTLVIAAFGTEYYARSTYYVGLDGRQVTIFQGRPGGVLWWKPTVSEHTALTTSGVLPVSLPALQAGVQESSLAAAHSYVTNLVREKARDSRR